MADWSKPVLGDAYADFLDFISDRLDDVAEMFNSAPSNQPDHTIRFNRTANVGKFQEWLTGTWNDQAISIAGGGTGATSASGARTALGLGTISTQDSNNVTITGGTIGGATVIDAATIASVAGSHITQTALGTGSAGAGAKFLADDQTYKTITNAFIFLAKSANYTVTNANIIAHTLFLLTNTITITLPTVNDATIDGLLLILKNVGSGAITVNPDGTDTIDGAASLTIPAGAAGSRFSFSLVANKTSGRWEII